MTGGLGHKRKLEGQGEGTTADDNDFSPSPSTPSLSPPPPPPTTSHSSPTSTPLGSRLLLKAGYRGAGGLGRLEQGSSAPLSPSQQLSTHGLGFRSTTTKRRRHSYTPAPHVQVAISPEWLPTTPSLSPPPSPPLSYLTIAPHDDSLTTSPLYCPLTLQHALHTAKSAFDCIDPRTFRAARTRANPFELLRAEMFQNRAALKMAEVDRITERLFTSMPAARPLLRFGDVCAGPGGFSEYVLTRVKWRGKGWGLTLRGAQDFRVDKFNPNAPPHSFKACYGADGTGDVTRSDNIRHFAREVQSECEGLDVCMADGGFDVAGEEDKQELRSQQLILCECIIALAALRVGGSFVCKLFDVFLPFSVGLLYLMHRCFDALAIIKPNQSRPANSERYLVCRGKREGIDGVLRYLYHANDRINELKRTPSTFPNKSDRRRPRSPPPPLSFPPAEPEMAVLSLVPEDVITADAAFLSYIQRSNESIAERQVDALQRLLRYVEDPNLPSDDQEGIRLQCLRWWEVTDQREQEARREQRRRRVERDGLEDVAAVEQVEGEDDEVDEVGYIHFDPSWGSLHFSRHPHQGFFSQQAADRLHADLIEQLRSVIPLEPLPTVEEREAYRKRTHSQRAHTLCALRSLLCLCASLCLSLLPSVSGAQCAAAALVLRPQLVVPAGAQRWSALVHPLLTCRPVPTR